LSVWTVRICKMVRLRLRLGCVVGEQFVGKDSLSRILRLCSWEGRRCVYKQRKQILREEWRGSVSECCVSIFFRTKAFPTRGFHFGQVLKEIKTLINQHLNNADSLGLHILTVFIIGRDNLMLYNTLCMPTCRLWNVI
jgi:hypothetical protein